MRTRLLTGWTNERRNCYVEHVDVFKQSPYHTEHVLLHIHVDTKRLKAIYRCLKRVRGVVVGERQLYNGDFAYIGLRLYRDQTDPLARTFVERVFDVAILTKLGDKRRQFVI